MKWLFFLVFLGNALFAAVDTQIWMYTSVNTDVGKKSVVHFEFEERFNKGGSRLYLYYVGAFYGHHFLKCFEMRGGYRQFWISRLGEWMPIYIPIVDGIYTHERWGFSLRNRCRVEYQIFDHGPNRWMYRNLLELSLPVKLGNVKLQPILLNEVFFFEYVGFWQNRIGGGGLFHISEKIRCRMLYMYRTLKLPAPLGWQADNVMYNMLVIKF